MYSLIEFWGCLWEDCRARWAACYSAGWDRWIHVLGVRENYPDYTYIDGWILDLGQKLQQQRHMYLLETNAEMMPLAVVGMVLRLLYDYDPNLATLMHLSRQEEVETQEPFGLTPASHPASCSRIRRRTKVWFEQLPKMMISSEGKQKLDNRSVVKRDIVCVGHWYLPTFPKWKGDGMG